jgi:tetratricopeptide (TPR) repeat protein
MVSRGPQWFQRWRWRKRFPRIDDVLTKPFHREDLAQALDRAYATRIANCGTLLYLGAETPLFREVERGVNESAGHWQRIARFDDEKGLEREIRALDGVVGAVLIDPTVDERFSRHGWHTVRDGLVAQRAPIVCLSRDPRLAAPFAGICDRFVHPPEAAAGWQVLLEGLAKSLRTGGKARLAIRRFKAARKNADHRLERRCARRLRAFATTEPEVALLVAQELQARSPAAAIACLENALALNPFFPRTYLMLFALYGAQGNHARARALAEDAARYCPQHRQTQEHVAKLRST